MPALEHDCAIAGLRLIAVPPGRVEIGYVTDAHVLDVNLNAAALEWAINGDKMRRGSVPADSFAWAPAFTDFRLRTRNHCWGLMLEFEPVHTNALVAERLDGRDLPDRFHDYRAAPRAALLGRMAIDHLRRGEPDRLLLEGLGLAILADALGVMEANAVPAPTREGLARAVDLIEARLADDLSMAELAAAVGMSPSWFAQSFRTATGEPVFAYVRRRRLDRARTMLADPRLTLSAIAHACGFADQSHMTRGFRQRWGTTPARMRRGG